jgi:alanine or glycine:cation symporter, AGCS family
LPFIVAWLVVGATVFTLKMNFINFRGFVHGIKVVMGRYTKPGDKGDVSHFQALSAALSATVGLGNIAGVAIAVSVGGPGATFWMILAGILGMSSKFTECTLGQMYREVRPDGKIMGGPMFYLSKGLAEKGFGSLGKFLAVLFAIFCIGGSLGGGNAFQVNQSLNAVQQSIPMLNDYPWLYGLIFTLLGGMVIIGGITRIAVVAEKIVPSMCGIYVLACLVILITNVSAIPSAIGTIISGAFTPAAGYGGLIGVLVQGFKRAAFSNEAGVGSASIAHSAAKTPYAVREGLVSLLEPFIDTIVVCTMTALVIVITGAYNNPDYESIRVASQGATLTSMAMGEQISWFPAILSLATVLFAFSTMISWSYYGERCWSYLVGEKNSMIFKVGFLIVTFLGSIVTSTNVLDFSDLLLLSMAFPNILGAYFLMDKVKKALDDYMTKLRNGEF